MSAGWFSNLCPRCGRGAIFRGFYCMHEACPACGHRYGREEGFFLGAMVFSYVFGILSMVPTVVGLVFFVQDASLAAIIGLPILQILLMNPILFRYSRIIWIHLADRIDAKD